MRALLWEPFSAPYVRRALLQVLVLGFVAGAAGVYVVLRRIAFVSDTLTHTVFPGAAISFALGGNILIGATVAGVLTAVLLAVLVSVRRVNEDAALAVLLTSFFAVGVLVVSRSRGYTTDLQLLLIGRGIFLVDASQIAETAVIGGVVLLGLVALHKELLLRAFDPDAAEAMGYRPALLDIALNVGVALVVVAGIRTAGTLLTIALVVVPGATARLLSDRVAVMVPLAGAIGMLGGYVGVVVAYTASVEHGVPLAGGATVVAVLVGFFLLALAVAGLRARAAREGVGDALVAAS